MVNIQIVLVVYQQVYYVLIQVLVDLATLNQLTWIHSLTIYLNWRQESGESKLILNHNVLLYILSVRMITP